jgi:uncharacterized protein (UPF0335 family)
MDTPNNTAVSVLKQAIERTQANISLAVNAVKEAKDAVRTAEELFSRLNKQECDEVKSLYLIAKGDGFTPKQIQELMHEMNQDCEEEDCQECCGEFHGHEFDSSEGGYCQCGANGYENGE